MKKKLLVIFLSAVAAVCLALGLSACSKSSVTNIPAEDCYYIADATVSYRYSYSITIDDSDFVLYTTIAGSDGSYSFENEPGTMDYISEYDTYLLTYNNGGSRYIKFTDSAFYFCDAYGIKNGGGTTDESSGNTTLDFTPRSGNSCYGYYEFANEEEGEEMQHIYYLMYIACELFASSTEDVNEVNGEYSISYISFATSSLTVDEVISVWKIFYAENPMYYWLANVIYIENWAFNLCIDKTYAKYENRSVYDEDIETMVQESVTLVAQKSSDLEKAMAIHDYIINKMDYAYKSDGVTPETAIWAHNITGVSSKGYGVCESYAKTFLALCLINGLECINVYGYAYNGEYHVWNLVKIEAAWYGVDCTWDDTGTDYILYTYFGMSDSTAAEEHTADDNSEYGSYYLYGLPEMSATDIQLVTLYYGDDNLGYYPCIDAAFAAMTDPYGEYTIELYPYEFSSSPGHYIYSQKTPSVATIKIIGSRYEYDYGIYSITCLFLSDSLVLNCNLVFYNLALTYTNTSGGDSASADNVQAICSAVPQTLPFAQKWGVDN